MTNIHAFRYIDIIAQLYFSQQLEQIEGGKRLWENKDKLSKNKWMVELLKLICGSSKASAKMRLICLRYYRGTEDLSLQNWSGVDQHLATVLESFVIYDVVLIVFISGFFFGNLKQLEPF